MTCIHSQANLAAADLIEKLDPGGTDGTLFLVLASRVDDAIQTALRSEHKRQHTAIVGLIQAVKGTTEWDEHNAACGNERYGDIDGIDDCDCAHAELHAAVQAGEEATHHGP